MFANLKSPPQLIQAPSLLAPDPTLRQRNVSSQKAFAGVTASTTRNRSAQKDGASAIVGSSSAVSTASSTGTRVSTGTGTERGTATSSVMSVHSVPIVPAGEDQEKGSSPPAVEQNKLPARDPPATAATQDETVIAVLNDIWQRPVGTRNLGEFRWEKGESIFARWKKLFFLRFKLYCFSLALVAVLAGTYMQIGNLAAAQYIDYAMEHHYDQLTNWPASIRWNHLPDVFLDIIHAPAEDGILTILGDTIPYAGCFLGVLYLFLYDHVTELVMCGNLFAVHWIFNGIAENVTILPTSYGFERCLARSNMELGDKHQYAVANTTGSCAAMMWSGHTFVTYLSCWGVMRGAAAQNPTLWDAPPSFLKSSLPRFLKGVFKLRNIFCFTIVTAELVLLLLDHAHYTVDLYVAILLSFLACGNEKVQFYLYYINPYTKGGGVPFERNVFYQKLATRKVLFLSKHKGGLEGYGIERPKDQYYMQEPVVPGEAEAGGSSADVAKVTDVELNEGAGGGRGNAVPPPIKVVFDPWSAVDREMADFWDY
eukprot:CAMPEP_0178992762 /NCGR_PEP_ID=MMETSP0795-20121207/6300_1 /TAXON_ID=88552 /ORGANISM="Amoebophrya sp., Strain Ameob2" /LENGTH=538 /DNA_ID=CAMNT_0020684691 /DNA_START=341 /DNA_END=1957 /DNA_ORIENTATION=+